MTRKSACQATIAVDNPHRQPGHPTAIATVTVLRALRDDPLARLHARRQITASQFRAGRQWQAARETIEASSLPSIDPAAPFVDCARRLPPPPSIDRINRARGDLTRWSAALGDVGANLIELVLVRGHTCEQIAAANGEPSARAVDYWGRRLREVLTTLADRMGC
jgi:hypothetical protein